MNAVKAQFRTRHVYAARPSRRRTSSWCVWRLVVLFALLLLVPPMTRVPVPTDLRATEIALPRTADGLHQMLVFNSAERGNQAQEEGLVDYVWGAGCQGSGCPVENVRVPGVWHEYYLPWGMDANGSRRGIDWFLANHPDWILYTGPTCDGAPTFGTDRCVAYTIQEGQSDRYYPNVPLDFSNPEVQEYISSQWIQPHMSSTSPFDGVSWDDNWSNGATGRWTSDNRWVALYNGRFGDDPAWTETQATAFSQMRDEFKSRYPDKSWSLNAGHFPYEMTSDWRPKLRWADTFMHEGGFTARVLPEQQWLRTVEAFTEVQKSAGKGLHLVNQVPYPVTRYMTDIDAGARADLRWALANYLLVKYDHTYFWFGAVSNYGFGPESLQQRETDPRSGQPNVNSIGVPMDRGHGSDFYSSQAVYLRDYSGGLTIVNPSLTSTRTVTLPPRSYRTLDGTAAGRSVELGPRSGAVLLVD